ncbi:TRZ/ATZ family hydrolase [Congregibacter brevis]|uniref:5-methylthioadenosine/S-adenosylhomocysteine deaminase n=1 Tax=Congregibacter brevis TaxID=3081201 RepID=A0ABZ0IHD7_9GAMM|nr:TRZ/ATZ family hydrolase [Congregibacter sp. IMCC45268]
MNPSSLTADFIIQPGWIIPMEPGDEALEDHAILVESRKIKSVLPLEALPDNLDIERIELPNHAVLPGLVNAHGHAAMSLLRGFADDLPLMPWLEDHIWPAETAHVSEEFVRDGTSLAMAEMLLSGTTTFSDMYFFPEVVASLCAKSGMRAQLATPVFEFPTAWGEGADDYISKSLALRDDCKNMDRLQIAFGPHSPYTVSVPTLEKVALYAAELDMGVHIHLHETAGEVLSAVEATGERPVDSLRRMGLLGPRTQCVHMTSIGKQDIANLAETGAQVIHCPQSNMKLASGTCPVNDLKAAGVNVGLGTDGAASNNDLNMFNEMHTAALLAKLTASDPTVMPALQVLHMATLGAAKALGLDQEIGSIAPGKQADLIAVDLSAPATQPLYNPLSQIVYACTGGEVTHSWVAGDALMRDRKLLTIDLDDTLARAKHWKQKISSL